MPRQFAPERDHGQAGPRGLAALVHLGRPGARPGLLLVLDRQHAETDGKPVFDRQRLHAPRALVADDVVMRGLAADDAAERDVAVPIAAEREPDGGRYLERA